MMQPEKYNRGIRYDYPTRTEKEIQHVPFDGQRNARAGFLRSSNVFMILKKDSAVLISVV